MSFFSAVKHFLTRSARPERPSVPAPSVPVVRKTGYLIPSPKGWDHIRAVVAGDDIIIEGIATAFGGDSDPLDNGETRSGYPTKGHPNLIGISLPMNTTSVFDKKHGFVLKNSPIPWMQFGLHKDGSKNLNGTFCDVLFPDGLVVQNVPMIDIGPANWTRKCADLTVALAKKHRREATANNYSSPVKVRIKGGAKYL